MLSKNEQQQIIELQKCEWEKAYYNAKINAMVWKELENEQQTERAAQEMTRAQKALNKLDELLQELEKEKGL